MSAWGQQGVRRTEGDIYTIGAIVANVSSCPPVVHTSSGAFLISVVLRSDFSYILRSIVPNFYRSRSRSGHPRRTYIQEPERTLNHVKHQPHCGTSGNIDPTVEEKAMQVP